VRSAKDVDVRTDIWSLGVVLFEMLTGRVPFLAETLPQLCALVLEQPAPLVSSLRPDVPPGLVAIVARCLENARERRFQTIAELAGALEPFAPPRHQRFGSSASPRASTVMPIVSGAPAPLGPSPPTHGGTGASWGGTIFEGKSAGVLGAI